MAATGVGWQHATRAHVRDWVLGLRGRPNPQRTGGERDRVAPGSGNLRVGNPSRRAGYAPATINHRLSVVAGFYQHHARLGNGPAVNPVPDDGPRGGRRNAHHNLMEPWTPGPRGSYRQKAEQRLPRAIPDVWEPDIRSPHATCTYSWVSPPSRSRRTTPPAGRTTSGSAGPSGGGCPKARCGRCTLW